MVDLESPKPHLIAKFRIKHKGKVPKVDLGTPGHRKAKDKPGKDRPGRAKGR